MKILSVLIGLFIGLGVRYLPALGLENAPGQVVATTHDGLVVVYIVVVVSYIAYAMMREAKNYEESERTQTEGVKRLWH